MRECRRFEYEMLVESKRNTRRTKQLNEKNKKKQIQKINKLREWFKLYTNEYICIV